MVGIDELGFLPGWGSTVGRVRESFQLLLDIVQAPDADTLEKFLARLPLMFKVRGGASLLTCLLFHDFKNTGMRLAFASSSLAGGHPFAAWILWPDERAWNA